MMRRDDPRDQAHFRSDRMFEEQGKWYFKIREGDAVGPFDDRETATLQLEIYIRSADSGLLPGEGALSPRRTSVKNTG